MFFDFIMKKREIIRYGMPYFYAVCIIHDYPGTQLINKRIHSIQGIPTEGSDEKELDNFLEQLVYVFRNFSELEVVYSEEES